jgi:hypothetical protein
VEEINKDVTAMKTENRKQKMGRLYYMIQIAYAILEIMP